MDWITYLWKGLVMGVIASAPIGPVALFAINKSLNEGHRSGFACGLGGALTDTTYAAVVAFAVTGIHFFIENHTSWIELVGGLIIAYLGWTMFRNRPKGESASVSASATASASADVTGRVTARDRRNYFLKATVTGLSNAGALFVMLALFTSFGLTVARPGWASALLILALFCGAATYWFVMSFILSRFHRFIQLKHVLWINRLAGLGVIGFGLYLLFHGGWSFIS